MEKSLHIIYKYKYYVKTIKYLIVFYSNINWKKSNDYGKRCTLIIANISRMLFLKKRENESIVLIFRIILCCGALILKGKNHNDNFAYFTHSFLKSMKWWGMMSTSIITFVNKNIHLLYSFDVIRKFLYEFNTPKRYTYDWETWFISNISKSLVYVHNI